MKGLDFWATDAWTDGRLPWFDVMRAAWKMYRNQTR